MAGMKEVAEMLRMKPADSWHASPVSPVTGSPRPTSAPGQPCDTAGCRVAGLPGKIWYPAAHKHPPPAEGEGHKDGKWTWIQQPILPSPRGAEGLG